MSKGIAVRDLVAGYGETIALDGVSLDVPAGSALAVLGRNGVGKTTLLCTLMGFTTLRSGSILLDGAELAGMPVHLRVRAGLGYVPQEREIFPSLTAEENLAVAARPGGWTIEAIFDLFPSLGERRRNAGNRLSGGEQQMLAIGRALAGGPDVLLLDEPMEGLAPIVVENVFDALARIRDESGLTILLVEQKAELALEFAKDVVVLDRGRIVYSGASADLRADEEAQARYLGVAADVG